MPATLTALQDQALDLSTEDRAELARVLLLSLEAGNEEVDPRIWAEEAERRYQDLATGGSEPIPNEVVFREARSRLR